MKLKIVTHNGKFHLDEILACAILQKIYEDTEIIRTRDVSLIENIINSGDYIAIIDVYGKYDHKRRFYDHHQRDFYEVFSDSHEIKLSSCGLVFKHYSKEFIKKFIKNGDLCSFDTFLESLIVEIYEEYFQYADAIDNGIDIKTKLRIRNMTDLVYDCNIEETSQNDSVFLDTLDIVKNDLYRYMSRKIKQLEKYALVEKYIQESNDPEILFVEYLKETANIVFEIEKRYNMDFKFVINEDEDFFKIYAIPVEKNSFKSKCLLNENWRGLRDKKLSEVAGIHDAVFVHSTGFLGITKSLSSAIKMCKMSMQ